MNWRLYFDKFGATRLYGDIMRWCVSTYGLCADDIGGIVFLSCVSAARRFDLRSPDGLRTAFRFVLAELQRELDADSDGAIQLAMETWLNIGESAGKLRLYYADRVDAR